MKGEPQQDHLQYRLEIALEDSEIRLDSLVYRGRPAILVGVRYKPKTYQNMICP